MELDQTLFLKMPPTSIWVGKDLEILAPAGRVVVVGSWGPIEVNPRDTMRNESSVVGVMLFQATKDELAESHAAIQAGMKAGWLQPIIGRVFTCRSCCSS